MSGSDLRTEEVSATDGTRPSPCDRWNAGAVRAAYHLAIEMLEECYPKAARILEGTEPNALAYLDFPGSHWKRLRTNNVQFRPASLNAHPWRRAA